MPVRRFAVWLSVFALLGGSAHLTVQAQTTPAQSAPSQPGPNLRGPSPANTAPAGKNPLALSYAAPNAAHGQEIGGSCAACHGPAGSSIKLGVPGLAGQTPEYLRFQLAAFRAKLRPSKVMQHVASKLSDQDIADLSAYFAAQPLGAPWPVAAAARAKGEALFMQGDAARNVIACQVCHGPSGRGVGANGVASVANLSPKYAAEILREFRHSPGYGGIPYPEAMRIAVAPLSDEDLDNLAAYISSMSPK